MLKQKEIRISEMLLITAILILFLFPISSAKPTKALLNVTMNWNITSDGTLNTAILEVSIPSNSTNQIVLYQNISENYSVVNGSDGSRILFTFNNIGNKSITGNFIVQTDYIDRNENEAELVPTDPALLGNTTTVVITPEIKELADSFKSQGFPQDLMGESTWVYTNIEYNESYSDVTVSDIVDNVMPSDWVFNNRVGVCSELSDLFAAMARSNGYPTRIITGMAYTEGKWVPHAWTEVYTQEYGWIEIDPTFNQVLNPNALRVRIGVAPDIEDLNDVINATTYNAKSVSIDSNTQVNILNFSEDEAIETDTSFASQPPLAQTQPVVIILTNTEPSPIVTSYEFVPPVTVDCSNCEGSVLLDANQTKEITLVLTLPSLVSNVKYTFPCTVTTDYGITNVSFDRVAAVQTTQDEYASMQDLPINFKLFIGLFFIGVIVLISVAIIFGW